MCLKLGYPTREEEDRILLRFGSEDPFQDLEAVTTPEEVMQMQVLRREVRVEESVRGYILDIINATRLHHEIDLGASPRASISLYQASQAWASIEGREYVIPDDVKAMAAKILTHRMIISPQAQLRGRDPSELIEAIVHEVPIPLEQ
jgi:MoxR-like ATPase